MMNLLSRPVVCLLIFMVLGFSVFSSAINGEFLYDDQVEIMENPNLHQVFPLSRSMFGYHNLAIRPLPYLTFAINYQLGNGETTSFHVVNILIHVLNACLIWSILIETLILKDIPERYQRWALPIAYIVTSLWMVHPLVSMPVNYIYQRMESMMSFFLLLTLYCSLQFFKLEQGQSDAVLDLRQKANSEKHATHKQGKLGKNIWMSAALLSCFAGMYCKEVMVVAPLLVLWYDRVFIAKSFLGIWQKRLFFYLGLFSCLIFLFGFILWQSDNYAEHKIDSMPSPWIYLLTQTKVLCWYLRLSFWPDSLCFEYDWKFASGLNEIAIYAVIILSLLAATLLLMWKIPQVGFVAGIFFLILGPTSSFKPILSPIFEHRMYLPVFSPIFLSVIATVEVLYIRRLLQSGFIRQIVLCSSVILIVTLGIVTWHRGTYYQTLISIWEDTRVKAPNSFRPYFQLCERYFHMGEFEKCRDNALLSIEKEPINPKAYHNLGLAYYKLKEDKKGWESLMKANQLEPNVAVTLLALGNHSVADKRFDEGCEYFKQAISANPNLAEAHHGFAVALMFNKGDVNTIYNHLYTAITLKPQLSLAQSHLALFLDSMGKTEMALEHAKIAMDLLPGDVDARNNYLNMLHKLQKMK